jgi:hypothetical protein
MNGNRNDSDKEIAGAADDPASLALDPALANFSTDRAAERRQPAMRRSRQGRRRSQGKVARLPLLIRNFVNQSLRDGLCYREIVGLLAAKGFPGFNEQNLSNWSRGGYRQWLAMQERFETQSPLSENAQAILGQLNADGHSDLADLNEAMLSIGFHKLLEGCDALTLIENSDDFFRLAKALAYFIGARAQRQRADLQRLQYELDLRKAERSKGNADEVKKVVSAETIHQFEAETKLI